MMLEIVAIVLATMLLGFITLGVIGFLRFRSLRTRHRRRVNVVQPARSAAATLIAVASEGRDQTQHVGTLAVGETQLIFAQLSPERDIIISRDSITSTGTTRHFLGKTTGNDLLVVTWTVQGQPDAMALAVADIESWREYLG